MHLVLQQALWHQEVYSVRDYLIGKPLALRFASDHFPLSSPLLSSSPPLPSLLLSFPPSTLCCLLDHEQSGSRKVTRRFKHFAWLHERLVRMFPCINIPAIPEKQVQVRHSTSQPCHHHHHHHHCGHSPPPKSPHCPTHPCLAVLWLAQGRFDESFIEQRRQKLERFLNRISRHPVLGSSSVFRHFLTATDQKEWKSGKRQAEAESSESKFLSSIVCAEALPASHEDDIGNYTQFANWFEKNLHSLESEYEALLKVHKGMSRLLLCMRLHVHVRACVCVCMCMCVHLCSSVFIFALVPWRHLALLS